MKTPNNEQNIEEKKPLEGDVNRMLKGIPASGGIGIGQAVVIERLTTEICPKRLLSPEDIPKEIGRFEAAVKIVAERLKNIKGSLDPHSPVAEYGYVFETQILLMEDRMFFDGTKKLITSERQNAEWALSDVMHNIMSVFHSIEDEYLRERSKDIYFVGERVLRVLMGVPTEQKTHQLPPNAILVAHDLSPADTAQLKRDEVFGFVTHIGGRTSHTAIMARSLKIPAVTGLEDISHAQTGETIIVDGSSGIVILNPDPEMLFRYRQRQEAYQRYQESLMAYGRLPAVTRDGTRSVRITANIEFADEADVLLRHGSEGVGLLRTEYLFMGRPDLPSEEEQFQAYSLVLSKMAPNPVTIRTLDVGGDKLTTNLHLSRERNPALGLRAIRLSLEKRDLFKTQLRAILRAAVNGNCRLLVPMISSLPEIQLTKQVITEVKEDLRNDKIQFDEQLKVGVLIEVPAAVAIADLLAKEADFFSIGTNDLIQYLLAIDRLNEHVNYLYDTLHPAVLRMLRQITSTGQAAGLHVAMCGEMAADPVSIPVLLGLGIDEFSINAFSIPMVKKLIRSLSMEECTELTRQAFEMNSAQEVRGFLTSWLVEQFPSDDFTNLS